MHLCASPLTDRQLWKPRRGVRQWLIGALLLGVLLPWGVALAAKPTVADDGGAAQVDLAGSASCRDCHERFYELWAPSHHGMAMQPYSDAFAADALKPHAAAIKVGDHHYRAFVGENEGWVRERGSETERKLPIAHVLGGKNVYYFLTPGERGRLQTLPVAYDVRREAWFDTAGSGVRHFPGQEADAPLHWTEREFTFNTACYSCHVSQLSTNYDLKTDTYNTTWAEPGINCETCHGPAGEHVRVFREAAKKGETPDKLHIISTRAFDVEQTNTMCAPCHAKMIPITDGYVPGELYADHYDLIGLEHPDFYPDGRDLGENYTYTLWRMSPCVKSGQLSCMHCHTSSGRFRFADDPNQSCLPCHQKRVENAVAHTHHEAGSEGNQCIACHMPKTEFARMTRSDHSMLPPTPAATMAFASPNACNLCHTDEDAAWADKWVREWRSRDYQKPVLARGTLIEAARQEDWSRLPQMLAYLRSAERDEIVTMSLIRLLRACPDESKWPVLVQALEDSSPLVRAAAAEALETSPSMEAVMGLVKAARDPYRLVRVRAAGSLAGIPVERLQPADKTAVEAASAEFMAAMRARPDQASAHFNLANYQAQCGELDKATASYAIAARLDDRDPAPLVNASLVHNAQGDNAAAEKALREALARDPQNVAAHLNLGMLLGEMGRTADAQAAFRAALAADPTSAVAAFNLGVMLANAGDAEGLTWCRRAVELRPDEPRYAYTLAFYLRHAEDQAGAIKVLEPLVKRGPADAPIYALLAECHVHQGDRQAAAEVYRAAMNDPHLTNQDRATFAMRLEALETSGD